MRRREFIALVGGAAAAWPLAGHAQQPAVPIIGVLEPWSPAASASYLARFREGLNETGYVEGHNVIFDYRSAEGKNDRLPVLADELVRGGAAVIVASAIRAALAAKAATNTVPIVFATANDPVQFGLVKSLNRPGGNATGVSWLTAMLGEKRLGLLHELVPTATVVAVLVNPNNANADANVGNAQAAAHTLGMQVHLLKATDEQSLEGAFAGVVQQRAGLLLVLNDPLFTDLRPQIVALAARHALPAIYSQREYLDLGGLMSYGASVPEAYRQVGIYTGRILKGEKPADLPVVQSAKFELVINLKTARALGLTIPPCVLAIADEVIE
jgi:putative tryptophan/tyrosine transport system substrate-binding protein